MDKSTYDYKKRMMRGMLTEFADAFSNNTEPPTYKVMVALKVALEARGIPEKVAAATVSSMKINVNQMFVDDREFMDEVVAAYADALGKIFLNIQRDFGNFSDMVMSNMGSDMSINFTD